MPEDAEKPKKKRGRPKGSTSKSRTKASREEEPQFETELGETESKKPKAEEPKVETKSEEPIEEIDVESTEEPEAEPEKPKKTTKPVVASGIAMTATEAAALAEAEEKAAAARLAAVRSAAETAAEEEYKAAVADAVEVETGESFTNKRGQETIFRREMGEPEFFLTMDDLVPVVPVLTPDEEAEVSRKVQIPTDQTPDYKPEHVLSPEYQGLSNYERGVNEQKQELEEKLRRLQSSSDSNEQEIAQIQQDLTTLDYLYENYYNGMNVFRTAKDGRDKVRK